MLIWGMAGTTIQLVARQVGIVAARNVVMRKRMTSIQCLGKESIRRGGIQVVKKCIEVAMSSVLFVEE